MKTREAKTFVGVRSHGDARVWVQTRSSMFPLPPRLEVRNHSPSGFEWGYGGSGPAQLALAICLELLEDPARALAVYQDVKWRFIGNLEGDTWHLEGADVMSYVVGLETVQRAREVLELGPEWQPTDAPADPLGLLEREEEEDRRRGPEGDAL